MRTNIYLCPRSSQEVAPTHFHIILNEVEDPSWPLWSLDLARSFLDFAYYNGQISREESERMESDLKKLIEEGAREGDGFLKKNPLTHYDRGIVDQIRLARDWRSLFRREVNKFNLRVFGARNLITDELLSSDPAEIPLECDFVRRVGEIAYPLLVSEVLPPS